MFIIQMVESWSSNRENRVFYRRDSIDNRRCSGVLRAAMRSRDLPENLLSSD